MADRRMQHPLDVFLDLIPMPPKRIGPGEALTWWRGARQDCLELVSHAAGVEGPEEKAAWSELAREVEAVDAAVKRAMDQGRPLSFQRNQDRYRRFATLSQLVDSARRLYASSAPPRILAAIDRGAGHRNRHIANHPSGQASV